MINYSISHTRFLLNSLRLNWKFSKCSNFVQPREITVQKCAESSATPFVQGKKPETKFLKRHTNNHVRVNLECDKQQMTGHISGDTFLVVDMKYPE